MTLHSVRGITSRNRASYSLISRGFIWAVNKRSISPRSRNNITATLAPMMLILIIPYTQNCSRWVSRSPPISKPKFAEIVTSGLQFCAGYREDMRILRCFFQVLSKLNWSTSYEIRPAVP